MQTIRGIEISFQNGSQRDLLKKLRSSLFFSGKNSSWRLWPSPLLLSEDHIPLHTTVPDDAGQAGLNCWLCLWRFFSCCGSALNVWNGCHWMVVIRCHWSCIIAVIIWPRTIQLSMVSSPDLTPGWWQHNCLGRDSPPSLPTGQCQSSPAPPVSRWSSTWLTSETLQWCKCDYK